MTSRRSLYRLRPLSLTGCLLTAIVVFSLIQTSLSAVLAIDYGSEWIKASLMKPGVPFDVLLNRDSKRKTQAVVAWKNDDRLFGSDAAAIATRFPLDSYTHLKPLLGAPFTADAVDAQRAFSPVALFPTTRDTVGLKRSNGTGWSVEELVAMQLAQIKELADAVAGSGDPVRDAVVAVPPYFTQFERDALVDALEIAGLRLLALVNDGTAAALNYALARTFPEEREWHVVYDAGASSVRATVVGFQSVPADAKAKDSKNGKGYTQVTVAGVGFDRGAGGTELDRRLRDLLASEFNVRNPKHDIRGDVKGMAKLWREAARLKAILSTVPEARANIESLAYDLDFKARVTKGEFEAACADLHPRFAQPILDALERAGLGLENVTSVILTGGHSRTPMVQAAVKAAVGEGKIATSVNADEAAVLGAAFYGASVSRQFRTKEIRVHDIGAYDIQVAYLSESKGVDAFGNELRKKISTLVFPRGSKAGARKTLTFKRKEEMLLTMSYRGGVGDGLPSELLEAKITGITDAIGNLTERGAVDPVVKVTVVLSESGFAGIQDAIAYGEIKDTSFTGKIKGLFSGGSTDDALPNSDEEHTDAETTTTETETAASTSGDASTTASSAASTPSADKKANGKDKDKKEDLSTISLKLEVKPLSIPALTPEEIRNSRARLREVDATEAAKRRREEARNNLEAYLYRLRDLLEDDDAQAPFKRCSKPEERAKMTETLEETLSWLHNEADEADTIHFWDKRNVLEQFERPIQFRYTEIEAFPTVLNNSQKVNFLTRMFLLEARQNLTKEDAEGVPSRYTAEELDALEGKLKEHESWLDEWLVKQRNVRQDEDPVILTSEMKARAKALEKAALKLANRKVPRVKKSSSTSTTTTRSTTTSTAATDETTDAPPRESTATEHTSQTHDEL